MSIWMAYAMLTGALFSLTAWLLESVFRGRGGAARFVWLGAMVLTIVLPCLAFLPQREAAIAPATSIAPDFDVSLLPILMGATAGDPVDVTDAQAVLARNYDRTLLAGWAIMSGVLALCLVVAFVGLRVRRRAWRSANVGGIHVLVSRDAGPAAIGMITPRIVLPEWSLEADRRALTLMLEHEAEHVRARDPLLLAGIGILLVAMPWNLSLWWQAARLRQAMELDCDARVLRRHPDPHRYAGVLLDVARGESRWLLASPAMARRRSLERRIRLLVPRRRPLRRTLPALAAAGALVLLACSAERPRPELAEPTLSDLPSQPDIEDAPPPPAAAADVADLDVTDVDVADMDVADVPVAPNASPAPPADAEAPDATPTDAERDAQSGSARTDVDADPSFTPMTVRPSLRNAAEVRAALQRFYPPVLRDAGVAGTAMVWLLIDEGGRVQRTQLQRSSGHEALDQSALRVADMMVFTPARNQDRNVAVWIQLPIAFGQSTGGDARAHIDATDPFAAADSLFRMVAFEPAATRPHGYPERLPFVPGTGATVTDFRDGVRAAIFWNEPPANIVDRATALSRADGWVLTSDTTQHLTPEFGVRVVQLERNGIERQIIAGTGDTSMAMLVQGPPEE